MKDYRVSLVYNILIFVIVVLGTIFIPRYIKEDLSKKIVIQKVACIILSIIGLIVLVYE